MHSHHTSALLGHMTTSTMQKFQDFDVHHIFHIHEQTPCHQAVGKKCHDQQQLISFSCQVTNHFLHHSFLKASCCQTVNVHFIQLAGPQWNDWWTSKHRKFKTKTSPSCALTSNLPQPWWDRLKHLMQTLCDIVFFSLSGTNSVILTVKDTKLSNVFPVDSSLHFKQANWLQSSTMQQRQGWVKWMLDACVLILSLVDHTTGAAFLDLWWCGKIDFCGMVNFHWIGKLSPFNNDFFNSRALQNCAVKSENSFWMILMWTTRKCEHACRVWDFIVQLLLVIPIWMKDKLSFCKMSPLGFHTPLALRWTPWWCCCNVCCLASWLNVHHWTRVQIPLQRFTHWEALLLQQPNQSSCQTRPLQMLTMMTLH